MKKTKAKSRKQRFRWKRIRIPALGNVFQGIVSRFEDQVDTAMQKREVVYPRVVELARAAGGK